MQKPLSRPFASFGNACYAGYSLVFWGDSVSRGYEGHIGYRPLHELALDELESQALTVEVTENSVQILDVLISILAHDQIFIYLFIYLFTTI